MFAPRIAAVTLAIVSTTACQGGSGASATATPSPNSSFTSPPLPSGLPTGLPTAFGADLPAGDVPLAELIPSEARATGSWFATTSTGDAIVVAWEVPGDPFRTDRGFAVWRHTADPSGPWRPVFAAGYPAARNPVLGITATVVDVTGDGSQDVLSFAETGGSGACGTYLVIDVAAGARVLRRSVCDTRIDPSTDPAGLVVTEAVYAHGDPHCCPGATRTTVLRYAGDGVWSTVSQTTART